MTWDIIGMLAVGAGSRRCFTRRRTRCEGGRRALPRWIMPAAIGLGCWALRSGTNTVGMAASPGNCRRRLQVLETGSGGKAWRPWAFVVPVVNRIALIDRARLSDGRAASLRGQVLFVERWQPTRQVTLDFDCPGARIRAVAARAPTTGAPARAIRIRRDLRQKEG